MTGENGASHDEGAPLSIWAHRLGEKFPRSLPILDASVDRVILQGTFNERLAGDEQRRRLDEVRRVLRPSGTVQLHMLTSDRPTGGQRIRLPGPAALVEVVPEDGAVLALLTEAGFAAPRIVFQSSSPWFFAGECGLRETRIEATRP
jgi:hypothetical protein